VKIRKHWVLPIVTPMPLVKVREPFDHPKCCSSQSGTASAHSHTSSRVNVGWCLARGMSTKHGCGIVTKWTTGSRTSWLKVRNPDYSQWEPRPELFEARRDNAQHRDRWVKRRWPWCNASHAVPPFL